MASSPIIPQVRVLALPENLGFGGGSNAGFRAAKNDIVVLLNSDMRVEPDFLAPLLEGFTDDDVFAVSCQIFLGRPDETPRRDRPDAGLVAGWRSAREPSRRRRGRPAVPCFYGGGGSCAFDRAKFLALGGFDELLAPFYLEDTDLGYLAWKRGWKVLYQPASVVYHEHRGTIGKRFSRGIHPVGSEKNFVLFCWKNIHDWARLAGHFFFAFAGAVVTGWSGDAPGRASARGILRRLPATARRPALALAGAQLWPLSTMPKRSAARSRRTSTTASRNCQPRRSARACCSFRPIRSARPRMAAACSCTTRCANCRAGARCTPS